MKQWIALIFVLFLIGGCERKAPEHKVYQPNVKVTKLNTSSSSGTIYFPAVANAATKSQLSFRVTGEVTSIRVKEGDKVKKGQVIAQVDPKDYQLDVNNAQARYSVINKQFRRSKPLVRKGLLAKSQFDELSAERDIALSELRLAKLRLSFTKLKAPYNGIVSRVDAEQYENVQIGQPVLNLQSLDNLDVVVQVADRVFTHRPTIVMLSKVDASVRSPSGNIYPVIIKEFTTEPNPTTGTFTLTFSMPMPKKEVIFDGMAMQIRASRPTSKAIAMTEGIFVPIEAVFNSDGDALDRSNKFVWLVNDDDTVSKHPISIGVATQDKLQVLSGLNSGNIIVTAGIDKLRDGMKVSIISGRENDE